VGHAGKRRGWGTSLNLAAGAARGRTAEDAAWREAVLNRDGNACVSCGSTEQLEADHIKPVYLYPDLRFNVDNGRTLCHGCHLATETYGSKVKRLVDVEVKLTEDSFNR
jgi:5-methylcytosine-specific restriction endonuclease McrA